MSNIEPAAFRLEPLAQDPTLAEGLRMAIADPAWLLARQRQFLELSGHDAGSLSAAEISWQTAPLTRYRPALPDGTPGETADFTAAPLEAVVEHDRPDGQPDALLAGLAGLQLRRLVQPAAATAPAIADYLAALPEAWPLAVPADDHPLLAILSDGAIDGTAFYTALRSTLGQTPPGLPSYPPLATASQSAVLSAARAFMAYYEALTGTAPGTDDAWVAGRLEYQFGLGGRVPDGSEVVLAADQFDSGQLDWYSVDVDTSSVGADGDTIPPGVASLAFLPTPVTFPGMPASRLWTIEDSAVSLDQLQAAPEDVAAMLVLEFALSYSDEFYLVPLTLTVGSLWQITGLSVTDTFSVTTEVSAADELTLFSLDVRGGSGRSPWNVLFPSVVDSRISPPGELVELRRDEVADICWAIERRVTNPAGAVVDRDAAAVVGRPSAAPAVSDGAARAYVLHSDIPANWYPLMSSSATDLSLFRSAGQAAPSGQVLTELVAAPIAQEEVTRVGKQISRYWRYARGPDGGQYLWSARRVDPPPPTASIRLTFDAAPPATDPG